MRSIVNILLLGTLVTIAAASDSRTYGFPQRRALDRPCQPGPLSRRAYPLLIETMRDVQ
jgi:hypothetical protein